ncbi:SGNH/GDSL hydrolase family protein [Candidatus Woesearchaeota archaeon]|nr:SGNH/GDSL hydrolase family protein [Candidatus Woesearchaeota archaeon]
MNRIQKIKKSIKTVDNIQYFGALLILIGLIINPFVIEQLFSVNKNIESFGLKLCIVFFEIILLVIGTLIIKHSKKIIKNRKNILINLSLLVGSIIFILIMVELYLFFFVPVRVVNHDVYGWDNLEFTDITYNVKDIDGSVHEVNYITYEKGFRRYSEPDMDKTRILVLGDSLTDAQQVSNDEEYYSYLENNPDIQLFVKAVSGWGTLQKYLLLNDVYDIIKPDIIIFSFANNDFINNDLYLEKNSLIHNNNHVRPYLENDKIVYKNPSGVIFPEFIEDLRITKFLLHNIKQGFNTFRVNKQGIDLIEEINTKGENYPAFSNSVDTTSKILGLIKTRAKESKIFSFNIDLNEFDIKPIVERIIEENGIEMIPGVSEIVYEHAENSSVHGIDGVHWNKLGHKLAGDLISEYINDYLEEKNG